MQNTMIRVMDRISPSSAARGARADEPETKTDGAGFSAVLGLQAAPNVMPKPDAPVSESETPPSMPATAAGQAAQAKTPPPTAGQPTAIRPPIDPPTIGNQSENVALPTPSMPVENAIPVVPSAPVTGSAALSTDLGDEWLPEVTTPNSSQPDVRTTPPPLQTVSQLPEQMRTGVQVQAPTKPPKDALLELAWRDYSARLVGELQVRRQAGVSTTWEANAAKSGREGRPAELAQPTGAAREAVAQRIAFEPRTDAAWMRKEGPALPTVHPTPTATTETTRLVDPAAVPVLNESASPAQRPIANPAATAEPAHLDAKTQTNPTEPTSPRTAVRVEEVQALMDQVSRQIVRRVGEGGGSVRLRLEPPELGRLRLEVQVNQDVVRAQAVVESAKARAMLVEHLPLLKQVLAGQGMHLERFDVAEHSLQHQEANSQFTQDHSNARDDRPGASTPAGDQPSDPAGRQAPVYRLRGLAGNIHVTV